MNLKTVLAALAEVLVMLPAGVLVAAMLHRRGFLDRDVFRHAPPRDLGLGLLDLAVALCLFAMGSLVLAGTMTALHWPVGSPLAATHPAASQPASAAASATAPTTLPATQRASARELRPAGELAREAALALLGQGLMQLPMVLWLLARAGMQEGGLRKLGVIPRHPLRDVRVAAVGLAAAMPMVLGITGLTAAVGTLLGYKPPEVGHELLRAMREALAVSPGVLGALVASAALAAPLLEELIFRGLVQTTLLNMTDSAPRPAMLPLIGVRFRLLLLLTESLRGPVRRWGVVLAGAGIFALVHAGPAVAWQSLPALLILGIVLGWLYERTGSLLPGVLLHMGFNALNIALVLVIR